MESLVEVMRNVARKEVASIYTTQLGEVTAVFPHTADGDKDNYQCSVKLKNKKQDDGSDFELRKVPVATSQIGIANIPNVSDLVLIAFVNGDINAPVIIGRLYNDQDLPPVNDLGEIVITKTKRISIIMDSGAELDIDADGNITIDAPGDIIINKGEKGVAREEDEVEVEIPSGTFIEQVSGGGGAPAVGMPNAAPVKVQGKIVSASGTVKIGD